MNRIASCSIALVLATGQTACATAPPLSAKPTGVDQPDTAPAAILPLLTDDSKRYVMVATVAGVERRFLFDTGEGVTMVSPALAAAAGCEPWGNVVGFRMTGERMDTLRCDDVPFAVGTTRLNAPTTIVYDLAKITGAGPDPLDGAIGLDLFAGRTITVQLGRRQVVVESAGSAAGRVRGATEVPLRLSRPAEGVALDVNIGVPTAKGLAWMELDTGNSGPSVFIAPALAPLFGLSADTRELQGLTLDVAPGIRLQTKARVFPGMIMDGNVGVQLLHQYDVTLDLARGRAWLRPKE